MKVPYD